MALGWDFTDRRADTKFYWRDGSPLTSYVYCIISGEPNSPSDQRCGHIFGASDSRRGKWNDKACSLVKSDIFYAPVVLCQKSSR